MASAHPEPQLDYQQEAGAFLTSMDEMAPQIALDYSVESLQRLDQFISENFEAAGSRFVGETLPLRIGCYVGEVIIRHLGGHWNQDGLPEINDIGPITAIFPIERAQNRFEKGRQESLAWFYHAVQKRAYEAGMTEPHPEAHEPHLLEEGGLMSLFKGFFGK